MLKFPEIRCLNEIGRVRDSNYYKYHMKLGHATKRCYRLKDIL